jgi:hypothetical protein
MHKDRHIPKKTLDDMVENAKMRASEDTGL